MSLASISFSQTIVMGASEVSCSYYSKPTGRLPVAASLTITPSVAAGFQVDTSVISVDVVLASNDQCGPRLTLL